MSPSESDGAKPQPHSELKELSYGEEKGGGGEGEVQAKSTTDAPPLKGQNDPADGVIEAPGNDRTGTSEAEALQRLSPSEAHKDAIEDFTPRTESGDGNSPNDRPSVDSSRSNRLQMQDKLTQVKYLESQRNKGKEYHGQPREQNESTERHFERPGHDGVSYTDQLFAYGSVSGNGKKYVDDDDGDDDSRTKYRGKISPKDEPSASDAKQALASPGDARSRDRTSGNEPEMDQSPDEGRVNEEVEPIDQEIPSTYTAAASLESKNPERSFGSKGEEDGSSRRAQNYVEVSGGRKGLDKSRVNQESGISSEHDPHYSHDHYDDRKTGLDRIKTDRHWHPVDRPSLRTSYLNAGQAKSNNADDLPANRDQMSKGHRLPESVIPKRPLADAADDNHRHQSLVDYNSQELNPSKNHRPGPSEAGDRFLHGTKAEHHDYEQPGSKVANILPDDDYDRTGTKSVDVFPARNRFDHAASKSNKQRPSVLESNRPRPGRPGSKSRGELSQQGEYDRVNSKANDAVRDHGEFERQKVKAAVLPERSEHKMLSSELTRSGGKGRPLQNKDNDYSNGRGKVFGDYDSGNYEDEVGSPNSATWLKPEDQGNDLGSYVDPQQQAAADLSDSYDRDEAADAPYYVRSYYGGSNHGLRKNDRNYVRNGDYDYGTYTDSQSSSFDNILSLVLFASVYLCN